MGVLAILVVSIVAFFSFTHAPFLQGQKPVDRYWSGLGPRGEAYGPRRQAVVRDAEGNAHRSADGTQLTRRDRGREYWEANGADWPNSQRTVKNWVSQFFSKKEKAAITFPEPPIEIERPVILTPANDVAPTVAETPVSVETPPSLQPPYGLHLDVPLPLASPASTPLHQNQIETIPTLLPPAAPVFQSTASFGIGRRIQQAIRSDESLSKAVKLTIRVSWVDEKVTLRGLVLSQKSKEYIGNKAREIAGTAATIDNRLIALAS